MVLSVEYGGKTYEVPLAPSLTVRDTMELSSAAAIMDEQERGMAAFAVQHRVFCEAMGGDVVDSMQADEYAQLARAWNDASREAGATLGE